MNFLTTKVSRYRSLASQKKLLDAIEENDGRIDLSWGSNLIIQVAAGYADAPVEFTKGFATYDLLPGLFTGLTILDGRTGQPLSWKLDIHCIFPHIAAIPRAPREPPSSSPMPKPWLDRSWP